MRIIMIGSGNVATVLGRKLRIAGHSIMQVSGRKAANSERLAEELGAAVVLSPADITPDGDIYILAISDDELYQAKAWWVRTNKLVVHTAGIVGKEILKDISDNYGVLYPLQSLKKEIGVVNEIPLLIDGNTENNQQIIFELARSISDNVQFAGDEARKKLHLAAVIVNNFSNHLFALTEMYCKKEDIDFKRLWPLISEGALRLQHYSPSQLQTGPAIRNDRVTIEKHLELLKQHPDLLKVYELFTENILKIK